MPSQSVGKNNTPIAKPIIFFDGECNLCNAFVDLMLQIDRNQIFYLASLQGETAKQYLPPLPAEREEWAIAYYDGENTYQASEACLKICERLGGLWLLFTTAKLLTLDFRDWLYRIVASNRYNWFGQRICRTMKFGKPSPFLP